LRFTRRVCQEVHTCNIIIAESIHEREIKFALVGKGIGESKSGMLLYNTGCQDVEQNFIGRYGLITVLVTKAVRPLVGTGPLQTDFKHSHVFPAKTGAIISTQSVCHKIHQQGIGN